MKVSYPTDDVINIDHPFGNSLQNGFFPIGFYHCWHGGVHIEGKGKAIKAIADGKVIAFRYNKEEIKVGTKDGKPITLSNNFVLMRHDYISGSHTLTFYSLYYHLYFGEETKAEEKPAPPQEEKQKEKKYKAVPAINGGYKLSGIWSIDETVFFPTLTTLNIKEEKEDYYVVSGKDINSIHQTEVHIPKTYGNEKKPTIDNGKVKWTNIAYKGQKGILLYYTEGENKIARKAIAINSDITVKKESDPNWIEILYEGQSCFLKKTELENRKLKEEVVEVFPSTPKKTAPKKNNNFPPFLQNQKLIDEVQTCDIALSAGELIGYVGKQGIYNQPDYYAAHLEVFTPGNYNKVNEKGKIIDRMGMYQFIHNIKNDKYIEGAGQKHFFELKKGTVLKPYLKVSSEDYKGVIVTIDNKDPKKKTKDYTLVTPTQIVEELPENSYIPSIGKRNGKNFHYRDIVTKNRKSFWVRNNYIEEVPRKWEKNKVDYKLKMDTPYLYLTNPDEEKEYRNNEQQKRFCEFKDILSQMVLVDKSKCKEVTYEGKRWLYVKSYYYQQNKIIYNYGWIEHPKEEELFSAHCWNKFGFTRQDAEDHRIYPIEGVNHYSGTSEFIKKMIRLIDENEDKIIDNKELRAKYNSPGTYHILSKMVCKHQSEWSYSWERIKEDAKAFFKYHYPNYSSSQIQQSLNRTEKVFNATYTFWKELKDKLSGQDKTFFKEGVFWYFEPFAWVTQMMKVFDIYPPWLRIAIEKLKMAKGVDEGQEPLYSFAKKCLEFGGNKAKPNDNKYGQWCGGFVSWCLNAANQKVAEKGFQKLNSQQFIRLAEKGEVFKIIKEPVLGCIVVMSNYYYDKPNTLPYSGHITFLYGIDGDNLVCLGGNQGGRLKFSSYKKEGVSYYGKGYEQRFNCFLMPIDYPESLYDKNIPTITTNEANKKFGLNLKTVKNESTS